jgi:hypothetical protein
MYLSGHASQLRVVEVVSRFVTGVYPDLERFVRDHQPCGTMTAHLTLPGSVQCSCGVTFERWVTETAATADLIASDLPCLPN